MTAARPMPDMSGWPNERDKPATKPLSGHQKRMRRRELIKRTLDLYAEGRSIHGISIELDITMERAAELLGAGLMGHRVASGDQLATFRAATADLRLDKLAATFSALLDEPDPRLRLDAAIQLREIEIERAKLLAGEPDGAVDRSGFHFIV
jgi:hypothetical protein